MTAHLHHVECVVDGFFFCYHEFVDLKCAYFFLLIPEHLVYNGSLFVVVKSVEVVLELLFGDSKHLRGFNDALCCFCSHSRQFSNLRHIKSLSHEGLTYLSNSVSSYSSVVENDHVGNLFYAILFEWRKIGNSFSLRSTEKKLCHTILFSIKNSTCNHSGGVSCTIFLHHQMFLLFLLLDAIMHRVGTVASVDSSTFLIHCFWNLALEDDVVHFACEFINFVSIF